MYLGPVYLFKYIPLFIPNPQHQKIPSKLQRNNALPGRASVTFLDGSVKNLWQC